MRVTILRPAVVAVAVLGCVSAASGVAQAASAPDRQKPCAEAWSTVTLEGQALAADSVAGWTRVSDAFLSYSDGTFDGALSNVFGDVSAAAATYATALTSDAEGDPSRAPFDAALAKMGAICSSLTVTTHKVTSVPRFQRFTYQTGVVDGLSPSATAAANAQVAALVNSTVAAARKQNTGPCMAGARKCGYFVQTLTQRPCIEAIVCLAQKSGLLPVGANDTQSGVRTLPLSASTGRPVPLSSVVPADQTGVFLKGLNAAVAKVLAAGGLGKDPLWTPKLTLKDVQAWLPQPDGLHVWFDRYAVAPGSFGVVHVVVPWPGT